MTYTSNKVDGQNLMFAITTTHNGTEITFNVVCANDETEIPDLVAHYLEFLDAPPFVMEQPLQSAATGSADQQAMITALEARIAVLEAK